MNYIITPDYTIFDIEDKFVELAEYMNTVNPAGYSLEKNKRLLIDFYNLYKNSFGKSVKTYLLSVSNAIMSSIYYEMEADILPDNIGSNIYSMTNNFEEIEKTVKIYNLFEKAEDTLSILSGTEGKLIYLGNSSDNLDDHKAMQIRDLFGNRIFDDIYNMSNNNKTAMETVLSVQDLNPENTVLITADRAKAHAGKSLGMIPYYINRSRIEDLNMDHTVTADSHENMKIFQNNNDLNRCIYNKVKKGAKAVGDTG